MDYQFLLSIITNDNFYCLEIERVATGGLILTFQKKRLAIYRLGSINKVVTQTDNNAARQFISAIPHSRRLGMKVEELGNGKAVISMPYDKALIGDPVTKVIHGGAVSALMDTAGGAAVVAHPLAGLGTATLDLRTCDLRPPVKPSLQRRNAIMSPVAWHLFVPQPVMQTLRVR